MISNTKNKTEIDDNIMICVFQRFGNSVNLILSPHHNH